MNLTSINKPIDKMIDSFFSNSLSDLFGTDFIQNKPSVNILETEKDYILEVAVPGFDKSDIKLDIEKDHLIVSAEIEKESSEDYTKREFNYSSFKRSFHLSKNVNKEGIDATYTDGILSIRIEKTIPSPIATKNIKIK